MLEKQRIEIQKKVIENLKAENEQLREELEKTKENLAQVSAFVDSANGYLEEHNQQMVVLKQAKDRYDQAAKALVMEKLRYQKDFEDFMENLKKG